MSVLLTGLFRLLLECRDPARRAAPPRAAQRPDRAHVGLEWVFLRVGRGVPGADHRPSHAHDQLTSK